MQDNSETSEQERFPPSSNEQQEVVSTFVGCVRPSADGSQTHQCVVCQNDLPTADSQEANATAFMSGTCGHSYCKDCTIDFFSMSIQDRGIFPPRCCGVALPLDQALHLLPAELCQRFRESSVEYHTQNPLYCHRRECSSFIPTPASQGVAKCPQCGAETCCTCRSAAHDGEDCPQDLDLQQLREISQAERWQRCPGCKHLVGISSGCNHISKSEPPLPSPSPPPIHSRSSMANFFSYSVHLWHPVLLRLRGAVGDQV